MLDELKNLQPFRSLDSGALATVACHANRLRVPAQRWLLRRGQPLSRELYLVGGIVAARRDGGVERISARAAAGVSLNIRAAGVTEISTVTAVDIITVDIAPIRFLLGDQPTLGPAVTGVDAWMHALLQGPVMRWFSPDSWARVLRAGKLRKARRGERIVTSGTVCEVVFVVAEGVAASAERRFPPGDFFGEQSALGQLPASHDVVMESDGALVCFARADVLDLAAHYHAPRLDPPPRRFDLDQVTKEREDEALAALDPLPPIAVRGSDPARRLQVAAKLMRRGFTVV